MESVYLQGIQIDAQPKRAEISLLEYSSLLQQNEGTHVVQLSTVAIEQDTTAPPAVQLLLEEF